MILAGWESHEFPFPPYRFTSFSVLLCGRGGLFLAGSANDVLCGIRIAFAMYGIRGVRKQSLYMGRRRHSDAGPHWDRACKTFHELAVFQNARWVLLSVLKVRERALWKWAAPLCACFLRAILKLCADMSLFGNPVFGSRSNNAAAALKQEGAGLPRRMETNGLPCRDRFPI